MIETICVCGAGTMGTGIAQLAASKGFSVILFDVQTAATDQAKRSIEQSLQRLVEKGKLSAVDQQRTVSQIKFTNDTNDCIADLVIEAIVENAAIKTGLFNQLAEVNHSETIFASNTSSLPVTGIAAGVMHPERVAGMHFFNPATLMPLVEIVKTTFTRDAIIDELSALASLLGKTPVVCNDHPGFIVNRVARPFYIEALRLLEEGTADMETIDTLMEANGFKMGPFRLMDLIGNDINFTVSTSLYEQLGKPPRLRPSRIQEEKVKAGELGRKTGKGYYQY